MTEQTSQDLALVSFNDANTFAHVQRVAKCLSASELVPKQFQGEMGIPNCVIALEMSQRMNASVFAVMQSIYIVHGKPSWAATFMIACVNTCRKFRPIRFSMSGTQGKDDRGCIAWTVESDIDLSANVRTLEDAQKAGLPVLDGPPVTIEMAKKEGWFSKNGSKWQTMPELMLRYRAATFFTRLYAPEMLMGMKADDEVIDIEATVVPQAEAQPKFTTKKEEPKPETPKSEATATPKTATSAATSSPSGQLNLQAGSSSAPSAPGKKSKAAQTPQERIQTLCMQNGFEWADFKAWGVDAGEVDGACESFAGLPENESIVFIDRWEEILPNLEKGK